MSMTFKIFPKWKQKLAKSGFKIDFIETLELLFTTAECL